MDLLEQALTLLKVAVAVGAITFAYGCGWHATKIIFGTFVARYNQRVFAVQQQKMLEDHLAANPEAKLKVIDTEDDPGTSPDVGRTYL